MTFPLSIFGTAAAAGAAGPAYLQNRVDASQPASLNLQNTQLLTAANNVTLSVWFTAPTSPTNKAILDGLRIVVGDEFSIRVELNNQSRLRLRIVSSDSLRKDMITDNQVVAGQPYHVLISTTNVLNSTRFYVNDVLWTATGTDSGSSFNTGTPNDWGVMVNRTGSGATLGAPSVGDYWFDQTYFDFDVEANRRLFIDASGNPVPLGDNGEIPTGSVPRLFYGSNYVAADWNSGINLGAGPNFSGSGIFTDTTPFP